MKIALVNSPPWALNAPPLNLGYLTSYLRQNGHEVYPFDFNIETYVKSSSHHKYLWERDLDGDWIKNNSTFIYNEIEIWVQRVLRTKAQIIGISLYNDSKYICIQFAKAIKKKDPSKIIIFGGPQCSRGFLSEELLRERVVDVFVIGEGEETLLNLLDIYERDKKITYCKGTILRKNNSLMDCGDRILIKDLDRIPFPDYSNLPLQYYIQHEEISILGSRGCFAKCVFCQDFLNAGDYRFRSAENIFKEMCLRYDSGYTSFFFNDLTSNGNLHQLNELCDLIINSRLYRHIEITSEMRCRQEMTLSLYKKLYKGGWRIILYGAESGSQAILNKMNKGYNVHVIDKNIRDTYLAGIKAEVNLIVGFPGETEHTFKETLNLLKRNHKYIYNISALYQLDLREGSPIAINYRKYGIIKGDEYKCWHTSDCKNNYPWRLKLIYEVIKYANALNIKLGFDDTHFYFYHALTYYHKLKKDYKNSYEIMLETLEYLSAKIKKLEGKLRDIK